MNVGPDTRTTLIPDIQGSIIGTLDSSSGALIRIGYSPYGRSANTAGTFRYTGQRFCRKLSAATRGSEDAFYARVTT